MKYVQIDTVLSEQLLVYIIYLLEQYKVQATVDSWKNYGEKSPLKRTHQIFIFFLNTLLLLQQ